MAVERGSSGGHKIKEKKEAKKAWYKIRDENTKKNLQRKEE